LHGGRLIYALIVFEYGSSCQFLASDITEINRGLMLQEPPWDNDQKLAMAAIIAAKAR